MAVRKTSYAHNKAPSCMYAFHLEELHYDTKSTTTAYSSIINRAYTSYLVTFVGGPWSHAVYASGVYRALLGAPLLPAAHRL